jgi:MtN3 and saliva related transmembrane protein
VPRSTTTLSLSHSHVELVGFVAAVLTTASFVPQVIKILRERQTRGISLLMYVLFTLGVGLWLAYGLLIGSAPVAVANSIALVLAGTVLVMKLRLG